MSLRETKHFAPPELEELFKDPNSINIWSLRDRRTTDSVQTGH